MLQSNVNIIQYICVKSRASIKQLRILYIDSDLKGAGQLLRYFNPPKYLTAELAERSKKENVSYEFIFIHCRTHEIGLRTLVAHNSDPLAEKRGLQPFDSIFFETKKRVANNKYSWINFLEDIAQLGTLPERLNLPYGLLAFGSQSSEAIKDQLMYYGVRKFIKKPFSLENLENTLQEFFDTIFGSSRYYVEERPESETGVIRRIIRFFKRNGSLSGIHLPYLKKEEEDGRTTIWLHSVDASIEEDFDSEQNCIAIINEESEISELKIDS